MLINELFDLIFSELYGDLAYLLRAVLGMFIIIIRWTLLLFLCIGLLIVMLVSLYVMYYLIKTSFVCFY